MPLLTKEDNVPEYPKIQTIFKRPEGKGSKSKVIEGAWTLPEFEYLKDNIWEWTEKVDGTNVRVHWDGEIKLQVLFGGKTDKAQMPPHLLNRLEEMFPPEKFYGRQTMTLYGEGFGDKIQSGGKYLGKGNVSFVLFDVRIGRWWLKRDALLSISSELEVGIVPLVGYGTLVEAVDFIKRQQLQSHWGDFLAEGIVLKPKVPFLQRNGSRVITKLKHKDF